ncbi:hypothetical protein F2Q68_00008547 [Brassica cretica]|uniref:Uncharacterized protein n=1 Tax=Brassica cretica TaxID=69181 RepID=A0A8S9KX32_BRACR|nr:hypothetical protein F2Q68_00008547 [Brassica cretica]
MADQEKVQGIKLAYHILCKIRKSLPGCDDASSRVCYNKLIHLINQSAAFPFHKRWDLFFLADKKPKRSPSLCETLVTLSLSLLSKAIRRLRHFVSVSDDFRSFYNAPPTSENPCNNKQIFKGLKPNF